MLYILHYCEIKMSIGESGRVVIEINPQLKKALYSALIRDGLTLKDWFVQSAEDYIRNSTQGSLLFDDDKRTVKENPNETIR